MILIHRNFSQTRICRIIKESNLTHLSGCRYLSTRKKSNKPYRVIRENGVVMGSSVVPYSVERPPYAHDGILYPTSTSIDIKSDPEIWKMRKACRTARHVLACARKLIEICGSKLTAEDIDRVVFETCVALNVYPSPLGYKNFPKCVCTSVNNVACHGIPDVMKFQEGDIVSVDVSVYQDRFHGDTCQTFRVGKVDPAADKLINTTEKCLEEAIKICGPGVRFNKIGKTISSIARENGFSVCPYFVGHGIGEHFHTAPQILHHDNNYPGTMKPGMTFTIEPILCEGSPEIRILDDQWTAVTVDDGRAAQCEHTILITENGADVLTEDKEDDDKRAADDIRHFKYYGDESTWRT